MLMWRASAVRVGSGCVDDHKLTALGSHVPSPQKQPPDIEAVRRTLHQFDVGGEVGPVVPTSLTRWSGHCTFRNFTPGALDHVIMGCPLHEYKDSGSAVPGSIAHAKGTAGTDTNVGSLIQQFNQGVAVPSDSIGHGPTGLRGSWGPTRPAIGKGGGRNDNRSVQT